MMRNNTDSSKRFFVFISYNHKDAKWAKWLQRKLEWYRLPTEIHNELSDSRYIRPVFRDRDTLTSGILNDELRKHLEASKYLVVICSPNSAQSKWVSDEIQAFIDMGRLDRIVPFIIGGKRNKYIEADITQALPNECYPLALRRWNHDHPDKSILGISINEDGKTDRQKAFIRLVAHLLGVEFDTLWHRHRRLIRRLATIITAVALILLGYWFMTPVNLTVSIKDEESRLPSMEKGVLTINGSEYSFSHPDTTINVVALPGYLRLHQIPLSVHSDRFYFDESHRITIVPGSKQSLVLQMHRDSTFAIFSGIVYDGEAEDYLNNPIHGAVITLDGHEAQTDSAGRFSIILPLSEQKVFTLII